MRGQGTATYALAGGLLAAAPLVAFLATNGYPLLTPEAGILLAAACLAAAALTSFSAALGTTLAAFLLGAGVALCIDFMYGTHFSKPALLLVLLVCLALAAILRRHIALVVAAASFVFLVTTLAVPSTAADDAVRGEPARSEAPAAKLLPVVLHLVLDEHIGLDGLPKELPETVELERWLTDSYLEAGFRLYAGAYSEYSQTRNSIANLLNFTSHDDQWSHLVEGQIKPYVLKDSAYFQHLARLGYGLRVYQSDYIDLCRVRGLPYTKCLRYRANSIGSLYTTTLSTADRVHFILNSFLETSTYLARMRALYAKLRTSTPRLPLPAWDAGVSRVGPLAVLPVVEQLERDLRSASHGEAYFAHLLLPHYPYVLDESCRQREKIEHWLYNLPAAAAHSETTGNTPAGRAQRYRLYFAQIRCQQALLDRLFSAMKDAGVWDGAIVVVHGDHGSRIYRNLPTARNATRLTREDFNDGFSTLFAVRRPGLEAGVVRGPRPLQELLGEAFQVPMVPLSPKVYMRSESGKPLSHRGLQQFH